MVISIAIPDDCHCLLQSGEKITFGDPFLEKKVDQNLELNISKELAIEPNKIFQYLKKVVGDELKKDELIALKKNLFGEKKILSPVDGILKEINHQTGTILIADNKKQKKTVKSYFKGEVVASKKDRLEIEVGKSEEFPINTAETNFGGPTLYPNEKEIMRLTNADVDQKIIIIKSAPTLIQSKMEVLGAGGIVYLDLQIEINNTISAQLKNHDDFKKIMTKKYPYCLVDKNFSKIYFYELKKDN